MFFSTINLGLTLLILSISSIANAVPLAGQSLERTDNLYPAHPDHPEHPAHPEHPPHPQKPSKTKKQSTKYTTVSTTLSKSRTGYPSAQPTTTLTTSSQTQTTYQSTSQLPTPTVVVPPPGTCPAPLNLGVAANFAALGAAALTSTGLSLLQGDAGTFPGTSITGFPPGIVTGTTYSAQAPAQQGESACQSAFDAGFAKVASATPLPAELGGTSLSPGVYTFASLSAGLTGTLTLVGSGATCGGGQFIFLIPTTLTTAAASAIVLQNGAQACNVYFLVGTSATIGAASLIKGNLIASASITAGEGAENLGTFCTLTAAITLINNDLTAQTQCRV